MSWNSLPSELRLQILSHAAEGYLIPKEKAAPYATVSREWQSVIEDIIFRNISLVIGDVIDLDNFARLTSGDNAYRRDIIHNISVIIVLPRYQCEESCQPESADEIQQNNHVFTELMQALLGILSTWTPNLHPHGLTLELNIKSYSDMEHHFHNIQMHDRFVHKHWSYGFAPLYRDSGLTWSLLTGQANAGEFGGVIITQTGAMVQTKRERRTKYYAERPMCMNPSTKGRVRPLSLIDILSIQGHGFKQISVVEPYDLTVPIREMESIVATSLSKPLVTVGWHMLENVCFGSPLLRDYWPRMRPCLAVNELLKLSASIAEMMPKLRSWEICDKSDLTDRQGCIFCFSIDPSLSAASISLKFRWPRYAIKQFLFCPDVRNAWDKVAILRTGNSVNYLVDEKDISLPQGVNFELAPVHPFTAWLALRGNDRQLTEIYDHDLL
ncbi:f-box domain-containing [Fusarium sporotrichioides]|uniref:F-box domain-containing n=1 Tax=Fusarium sporotrichioides TaxID=5514 RepID=A0A395SC64_FUSSP|nr:f-box domain-containing [Fusarium sporotrichioides]